MTRAQGESGSARRFAGNGQALHCLIFTTMVRLAIGSIRLALLAFTPILTLGLVAIGLSGLGIALLFGSLLHAPRFHALPVIAIAAVSLGLVMALHKVIDLLRPR